MVDFNCFKQWKNSKGMDSWQLKHLMDDLTSILAAEARELRDRLSSQP